jgi:hypothetical protein
MNHEEAQPQRGDCDNDPDHTHDHGAENRRVEHYEAAKEEGQNRGPAHARTWLLNN